MREGLHEGDCLEVLRKMAEASVDAIVTDPPYGLRFMGKKWDYDVPTVEVWAECLRVLKPGGHLLAFAGTRTQHRMAVRIEDAGFEIRDMIAWVYGSGFPKSMDVSKAIDKMDAVEEQRARRFRFTEWVRSTGIIAAQIDVLTGTRMGHHYTTHPTQPSIMTREHLEACRMFLGDIPEWVERECDIRSVESRNMAERDVLAKKTKRLTERSTWATHVDGGMFRVGEKTWNITAPATDAAKQWQGWGTALKPALEPITVARKPLEGTVAANVLQWGTGGINVDGCRVETDGEQVQAQQAHRTGRFTTALDHDGERPREYSTSGRWPANLIHDGSEEAVGLFPSSQSGANPARRGGTGFHGAAGQESCHAPRGAESGSAARFFYCAKASQRERGEGNTHPTVKPIALMRYLCRLVTPPNGLVLDPFMGTGTTGLAAREEGFRFVGIEKDGESCEIARRRLGERSCGRDEA